MAIDGNPTNVGFLVIQLKVKSLRNLIQHVQGHLHDFGADAITWQYCKFNCFHSVL